MNRLGTSPDHAPRSTRPGHPSMGRRTRKSAEAGSSSVMSRHTARCTSSVSVVSQCKLVSGSGLIGRDQRASWFGNCITWVELSSEKITKVLIRSIEIMWKSVHGNFSFDVDCQYGEDVRSIWLTEYIRWCKEFADYNTRYKKWTCMKVL